MSFWKGLNKMGVEFKGKGRLFAKLDKLPTVFEKTTENAIDEFNEFVRSRAEENLSNIKHSSGELSGSIQVETLRQSMTVTGRVWTDKPQGTFREFGTGKVGQDSQKDLPPEPPSLSYTQDAWFIPVQAVKQDLNALYGIPLITMKDGSQFYMTRGQPARPWLYPAFRDGIESFEEIYQEHIQKALKEFE